MGEWVEAAAIVITWPKHTAQLPQCCRDVRHIAQPISIQQSHGRSNDMAGVHGDGWKYFPDYYRGDPMLCSSGCGMPRPRAGACSWCQRRQVPPGVTLLAKGANALQQCKWTWDHGQISRAKQAMGK